jgi:uncharacterized membrane protein YdfJ with MMPL/SSD domain
MPDEERTAFAAIVSLVGASMTVGGLLAVGRGGVVTVIGIVLLVVGTTTLALALAVGLRFWTPPQDPPRKDDGER